MQTFIPQAVPPESLITFEKYTEGTNASGKGAFSLSCSPSFELKISRRLGICSCLMTLTNAFDGEKYEYAFKYKKTELSTDVFTLEIDFPGLCEPEDCGLFFYGITLFSDDSHIYALSSVNNVDFEVRDASKHDAKEFRLLLYADGFHTPDWAKSAVMYHIFVDRFAKGDRDIPLRGDAVRIDGWENGTPEYAPYNGAPMKNNSFFGGDLYGAAQKLPYLSELGVNVIYLSPIFRAYSNHKYDTGDYETIDEMFGGKDAFDALIKEAEKYGISVILDGVFNHTGDDSKYFNRYGKYDTVGAYQSWDSPYHNWYDFQEFPEKYSCWWGIKILPKLMNDRPELKDFFLGEHGIVRKWLKSGTSGWRLDVADELPSEFLDLLRSAAKSEKEDSLIIGEVWENAADKVAYGEMRRYFLGHELDSVMNYPIKNAIIDFCLGADAESFYNTVTDIYSSYPPFVSSVLMNILGTHDTERILTVLSGVSGQGKSNEELSKAKLTQEQKAVAVSRLKLASVLQFTLPGMPSVFYGDEAGMEGYHDPFCRRPFPWGHADQDLTEHYRTLCKIKRNEKALHSSFLEFLKHENGFVCFKRENGGKTLTVAVNVSENTVNLSLEGRHCNLLTNSDFDGYIAPHSAVILKKRT